MKVNILVLRNFRHRARLVWWILVRLVTASAGRIGSGFVALHGTKSLLWCKSMFVPAESCLKTTSKLLGSEFGSGNGIQNWPKIRAQEVQRTP